MFIELNQVYFASLVSEVSCLHTSPIRVVVLLHLHLQALMQGSALRYSVGNACYSKDMQAAAGLQNAFRDCF